ncbi:acetolactate synthase 1 catalytic subunit, partial [Streptomyces nanshensis]
AIINNGALGMVRQWQTLFYNQRYSNTVLHSSEEGEPGRGTRVPDFVKLAEAMGCVGIRCEDPDQLDAVIEKANAINDRPVVVDFIVHEDAMVWPMVAAGTSNDEVMAARGVRPDFGDSDD